MAPKKVNANGCPPMVSCQTELVPVHSEPPSRNKRMKGDWRQQVEQEACFWDTHTPPLIPIPLNFTVHHFSQSPPGPRPSRVSLTDGLSDWHRGSGAQPQSWGAGTQRVDFCPQWYGKPASESQPDKPVPLILSSLCPGRRGEVSAARVLWQQPQDSAAAAAAHAWCWCL